MRTLSSLALALLVTACHVPAPLSPPADADASLPAEIEPLPPPDDPDAGSDDDGSISTAARACRVLAAHHCPESAAADAGRTCTELFALEARRGVFDLHGPCLAHATTLQAIHDCGARCPGGQ